MRNGSVTPREDGSAKQTQVLLLGRWSAEDVTKFEPLPGALVGALAQALLVLKVASNLYGKLLQPSLFRIPPKGSDELAQLTEKRRVLTES